MLSNLEAAHIVRVVRNGSDVYRPKIIATLRNVDVRAIFGLRALCPFGKPCISIFLRNVHPSKGGMRHWISVKILSYREISRFAPLFFGLVSVIIFLEKDTEAVSELLVGDVIFAKHVDVSLGSGPIKSLAWLHPA